MSAHTAHVCVAGSGPSCHVDSGGNRIKGAHERAWSTQGFPLGPQLPHLQGMVSADSLQLPAASEAAALHRATLPDTLLPEAVPCQGQPIMTGV